MTWPVERGEGLSAPSCFPRDRCQVPAPRARGSPGRTWPPRTRGDAEQGAARPQPRDDLPGGPRSLGAAQGQVSTRCHLEATRGSTTAPWKGWAVAAEPGSPSGQPERRDSQDRKPHGDQWHWKRSPATSFRLGPQHLQTQQPGDEDRRRQREAQRAHPGGLSRHARRRAASSASPSLPDSHRRLPGRSHGAAGPRPAWPRPGSAEGCSAGRAPSPAVTGRSCCCEAEAPLVSPAVSCPVPKGRPRSLAYGPSGWQPEKSLCSHRAPVMRPGNPLWANRSQLMGLLDRSAKSLLPRAPSVLQLLGAHTTGGRRERQTPVAPAQAAALAGPAVLGCEAPAPGLAPRLVVDRLPSTPVPQVPHHAGSGPL